MTDIRTRIADALREHDLGRMAVDIADVILALPGIAIVELPEASSSGCWSISSKNDLWVEDYGEVAQVLPRSSGMTTALRSPPLVRKVAAALLAAAEAAERGGVP